MTAGVITGVGGVALFLANQVVGTPRLPSRAVEETALPTDATATIGRHAATVLKVVAADQSPIIASGSYDNTAKLWNRFEPASVRSLPHSGRVNDLVFTPNGQHLVTGSGAGNLKFWNLGSNQLDKAIAAESGRITSVAVDGSSQLIASGSSNGTLKIWDVSAAPLSQGSPVTSKTLANVGPKLNALTFHPTDSNLLISGDQDGVVRLWDLAQGEVILTLEDDADRIVSIDISNNGQYVASGSYDQTIRIWDIETGDRIQKIDGHAFTVADVSFSPDSSLLASASYDESIKVWNWANAQELCTLSGHSGFVYTVMFADSGNTLVSGGYDGTVRAWDLTSATHQKCLNL
ncbi:MAG: WD40 repeat domain-containing protein [Cyanobacteria bacterium J06632_3]